MGDARCALRGGRGLRNGRRTILGVLTALGVLSDGRGFGAFDPHGAGHVFADVGEGPAVPHTVPSGRVTSVRAAGVRLLTCRPHLLGGAVRGGGISEGFTVSGDQVCHLADFAGESFEELAHVGAGLLGALCQQLVRVSHDG